MGRGRRVWAAASRGEGVLGLARALVAAGAAWVLATLWPVADAAAGALVADFVRGLAGGAPADEALRAAQARAAAAAAHMGARGGGARAVLGPDDGFDDFDDDLDMAGGGGGGAMETEPSGSSIGPGQGGAGGGAEVVGGGGAGAGGGGHGLSAAHWSAFVLVGCAD